MSKRAEEAALKTYPVHEGASPQWIKLHLSGGDCAVFIQGYEQAEKDLALTWEDIRTIFSLLDETARLLWFQNKKFNDKELCEETLRKFNKAKEDEQ